MDDSSTRCFSLLHDKTLPSELLLAEWSPCKDLLATASSDGCLSLHRLNWQRLWSHQTDLKISALAWRPDGKILAVGHVDGSLSLRDVETGIVGFTNSSLHCSSITSLSWSLHQMQPIASLPSSASSLPPSNLEKPSQLLFPSSYQDRTSRFFTPLPPLLPPEAKAAVADSIVQASDSDQPDDDKWRLEDGGGSSEMAVLCSSEEAGFVHLVAFGAFPFVRLDVRAAISHSSSSSNPSAAEAPEALGVKWRVSTATVHSSLSLLFVVLHNVPAKARHHQQQPEEQQQEAEGEQGTEGSQLLFAAFDCSLLSQRPAELLCVASHYAAIARLLNTLEAAEEGARSRWQEAVGQVKEKFARLAQLTKDHGSSSSPREELLGAFTSGSLSSSLQQFLASDWGEQGIRKAGKAMDAAADLLHGSIVLCLQSCLEELLFRFGELLSLSQLPPLFSPLGLNQSQLKKAVDTLTGALLLSEKLLQELNNLSIQLSHFFAGLLELLKPLLGETRPQAESSSQSADVAIILDFLDSNFEHDCISLHLQEQLAEHAAWQDDEWQRGRTRTDLHGRKDKPLLDDLRLLLGEADAAPLDALKRTLHVQLKLVSQQVSASLTNPSKALSSSFKLRTLVSIATPKFDATSQPDQTLRQQSSSEVKWTAAPNSLLLSAPSSSPRSVLFAISEGEVTAIRSAAEHETFRLPKVPSSSSSGSHVMLLRFSSAASGAEGAKDDASHLSSAPGGAALATDIEVAVLPIAGFEIVDLGFYRDEQLLLSLKECLIEGDDQKAESTSSCAVLLPTSDAIFSSLAVKGREMEVARDLVLRESPLQTYRSRTLRNFSATRPLALSAPRGLGAVPGLRRRLIVLDLQEDEETDEDGMDT